MEFLLTSHILFYFIFFYLVFSVSQSWVTFSTGPRSKNGPGLVQRKWRILLPFCVVRLSLNPVWGQEKGERNASALMVAPGSEEGRDTGRGGFNEGNGGGGSGGRERQTAWPLSSLGRLTGCSGKHRMWACRRGERA